MRAEFAEIDADAETAPGGVAEGRFGPDAILLAGFDAAGSKAWRKQLDDVGADMVRLVTATQDMRSGTLGEALETVQADAAAVATGCRRIGARLAARIVSACRERECEHLGL